VLFNFSIETLKKLQMSELLQAPRGDHSGRSGNSGNAAAYRQLEVERSESD